MLYGTAMNEARGLLALTIIAVACAAGCERESSEAVATTVSSAVSASVAASTPSAAVPSVVSPSASAEPPTPPEGSVQLGYCTLFGKCVDYVGKLGAESSPKEYCEKYGGKWFTGACKSGYKGTCHRPEPGGVISRTHDDTVAERVAEMCTRHLGVYTRP